jgi:hypothetical protein
MLLMKKKLTYCCLLALLNTASVFSQYIEKIWVDKADPVYGFYTIIKPASNRVQAALILLDGFGGNAEDFLSETKIHNVAWANDMLTVCIPTGQRLYADKSIIDYLNKVLTEISGTYKLRKDQFAIGGMSSGGTIALRYAELCHEKPAEFPILPAAAFDVDSPVDLIGLYRSSERDLKKNYQGWWLGEAKMITDRFSNELGDINGDLKKYHELSPFSGDLTAAGNESSLKGVAVRTYHDVDVNWFIQNRRRSLYETNMLDASEFINRLVLQGNTKAEFISSKTEGRRSNGQRHPHSWNIVDEIDLVQWLKEQMHFYPDHLQKPYGYTAPVSWTNETILFPMNFAAALPYKGFEALRFAPGWGDANSNEKWAYTILWWLDDKYSFNETVLQQNIETYFTGLTKQRASADKLDMTSFTPAKAQVQKTKTLPGDIASYTATAVIFDSEVTKKPGTLYFKIHIKDCPDKTKTLVLFEVAGSPVNAAVWQQLDKINDDVKCSQ